MESGMLRFPFQIHMLVLYKFIMLTIIFFFFLKNSIYYNKTVILGFRFTISN